MGPCQHGMARPQVADGGTASNMEGSCEYVQYAVADSRQGDVFQLAFCVRCKQVLTVKPSIIVKHKQILRIWNEP